MNNQAPTPARLWLGMAIRMSLFTLVVIWPAGTWRWWEGWTLIGLWSVYGVVMTHYLIRHEPALLAERLELLPLQKDQKTWDKVLMLLFFIAGYALYIVPGFDVVRYGWSEPLPLWLRVVAMLVHLPIMVVIGWLMRVNPYLAQVVKIDKARGQKVVTTGPYAVVRHPMYTVVIIMLFATPLALGSRYTLILSVFLSVLLIIRTVLEDRTLHEELEGYPAYAAQTPYRLVPGVW